MGSGPHSTPGRPQGYAPTRARISPPGPCIVGAGLAPALEIHPKFALMRGATTMDGPATAWHSSGTSCVAEKPGGLLARLSMQKPGTQIGVYHHERSTNILRPKRRLC